MPLLLTVRSNFFVIVTNVPLLQPDARSAVMGKLKEFPKMEN